MADDAIDAVLMFCLQLLYKLVLIPPIYLKARFTTATGYKYTVPYIQKGNIEMGWFYPLRIDNK